MTYQKRVCPNCGSENVEPDTSETTSFSHGNITDWICNECGYSGMMPQNSQSENSRTE